MPILAPDHWFRRITDIPAEFFVKQNIRLIALDVDNTLTTHDNPVPAEGTEQWLEKMRDAGLTLVILSNNNAPRVEPFAEKLGLSYAAKAAKPLPFGLIRTCREHGISLKECAIIGDQIYTDILCGNLAPGALSVLVTLMEPEDKPFFRLKRKLEQPVLCSFKKRHSDRVHF
ncbi:MAG: YqeG family HAD IIIA-type phosphatase [Oscillospiraceae bacterium]|nr:YqeG family HAD IIIA-type phosphatase [Oscillospiraceae bacterium]